MKKAVLLFLFAGLLLLSACGASSKQSDETSTYTADVTSAPEPITSPDYLAANPSYGSSRTLDGIMVRDESVQYRTDDSYRLESNAVSATIDVLRQTLTDPDSLEISDFNIWNCADDGENVYYSVHIDASYLIPSGERLNRSFFYDIGIRKADASSFDASGEMERVIAAFSVFRDAQRNADISASADNIDAYSEVAKEIALSRLKNRESGKFLSVKQRIDESDDSVSAWDVLCEGNNDYGMRLTDVYTVYLVNLGGKILEYDPTDPNSEIF